MEITFPMKKFIDNLGITGHLTIIKQFNSGEEEIVFDDHNIVVSGMGTGLSYLFTGSGSNDIIDYQIGRFQIGVSGPPEGGATSATFQLSGPLGVDYTVATDDYGPGSNLFIEDATQITPTVDILHQKFALIPANKMTRIGESSVRYTLVLDEESCNDLQGIAPDSEDLYLSEVGLFMNNPRGDANPNASILVAYRNFTIIRKTSDFSLIFRWTLNF